MCGGWGAAGEGSEHGSVVGTSTGYGAFMINGRSTPAEWPRLRPRLPSVEDLRSSFWFWPSVAAVVGVALGSTLGSIQPAAGTAFAGFAWPGDRDSATAFLQVVAGSVITVTSLTFSLVVVTLQLASQQFSPRLLREFARDLATQLVLGILVTTFVAAITVLRGLNADDELPALGLGLVFLLSLLSVSALLGFLGHITRLVRVDTMMAAVHRETRRALETTYLPYGEEQHRPDLPPEANTPDAAVLATKSGFVQRIDVARALSAAVRYDAVIVLGVRPGDEVAMGTPVAALVVQPERRAELERALLACIEFGYERTLEQDVALGFRQLTDIAAKALSPGVNDPTTAAHALGHIGDLIIRLQQRRLGPVVHAGPDGEPRVHQPDRDLRYYLDQTITPVRLYGADDPAVLLAVLRMLRDVAVAARDDEQRAEVARQADLVVASIPHAALKPDAEMVRDGAARVRLALDGEVLRAYADRAGETRSQ